MKINKKILSLPPYLSTSWGFVAALRLQDTDLLVHLLNGEVVAIPSLKPDLLQTIFEYHADHLETLGEQFRSTEKQSGKRLLNPISRAPILNTESAAESIFKIGFSSPDSMNAAMQHTPELADAPNLPEEVIEKIRAISKIMAPEEVMIPKAESHCNCPYCQIARAISDSGETSAPAPETIDHLEEDVKEEELQFQEWEITQSGDKLFTVVNKLDSQEKYSVYLGHPVGCTCGKSGCEHILAVLKS